MTKMLSEVHKILTLLIVLLLLPLAGFSESFWEGSITQANYGDLPQSGLYGASNAFPTGSRVVVTNPMNGKSVEVIIKKRLAGSTVLLALSEEAGKILGVSRGQLINGAMSLPGGSKPESEIVQEGTVKSDLETNPSNRERADTELSLIKKYIDTELGGEKIVVDKSGSEIEPVLPPEVPSDTVPKTESAAAEDTPVEVDIPAAASEASETTPAANEAGQPSAPPEKTEPEIAGEPDNDNPAVLSLLSSTPSQSVTMEAPLVFPVPDVPASKSAGAPVSAPPREKPESTVLRTTTPEITEKRTFRTIMLPSLGKEEKAAMERPEVVSMIARPNEETFDPPEIKTPEVPPLTKTPGDELQKPEVFVAEKGKAILETPFSEVYTAPDLKPDLKDRAAVKVVSKTPPVKSDVKPEIPKDAEIVLEPAAPKPPPQVPETKKEQIPSKEVEVTKVETAMRPAVEEAVEEKVSEERKELPRVAVASTLEKGSFYLQLGAYKEEYSAKDLAFTLSDRYPVMVLVSPKPESSRYRVMVGPLTPDEGGALLFNFRSMGYKDAFLKKGM